MVGLVVLLLIGCQKPKYTEAQMQTFRERAPYLTDACLKKIRFGGIEALKENDDCVQRLPRTRWRGLWRNDFEGSLFCPAPAQECENNSKGGIWLELEPRPAAVRDQLPGALYAVEFDGRRTAHGSPQQSYGYQEDIVVDRLISIKQIEAPLGQ